MVELAMATCMVNSWVFQIMKYSTPQKKIEVSKIPSEKNGKLNLFYPFAV